MGKELEKQEWDVIEEELTNNGAVLIHSYSNENSELEADVWIDIYKIKNTGLITISFEDGKVQLFSLAQDTESSTVDKLAFIESLASEVNDGSN